MIRRKFLFMAILAGIVLAGLAPPAQAAFRLRLEQIDKSGNATKGVVITDSGETGEIDYNGGFGAFKILVTVGLRQPPNPLDSAAFAAIDLNQVAVSAVGNATLRITLEATDFTEGPDGGMIVQSTVGGTQGAGISSTFRAWADPTNAVPDFGKDVQPAAALTPLAPVVPGTSVGTKPSLAFAGSPFSGTSTANFVKNGSYSLFSQAVITFTNGGTITFDQSTVTLPAPGGLLLALAALPVLGVGYLRRRLKKPSLIV